MATKKNAVAKNAAIKKARKNPSEIYILPNGSSVFPAKEPADGNEVKHPSRVFWQAQDANTYQIVLDTPPAPFKNVTFPIETVNGTTPTLTVDKKYVNKPYGYQVFKLIRGKFRNRSAGGIIIDS